MLEANSRETFSNAYFGLLVSLDLRDRLVANRIFADWSKRLFGAAVSSPVTPESEVGTDPAQHRPRRRYERGEDPFKRTLRQIDGILQVVSEGHDAIALRYLRELLDYQRDQPDLAVKSLCNLAQQCKELYRSDFERTCLDEALALRPFDPYVLVQFGDHLKRAGQFDDAREALGRAVTVASPQGRVVAQASLAHSYALEREYETAERMFREIPNWERDVSIRTALADLWRVTGRTVHAEAAYQEILREWPDQSRAVAGLAELAKREGDYLHAIELYQELLARTDMDRRSWVMWRLGLSHVFKLSGQLDDALRLVDEVVQEAPFNMDARVQRSALFGLLGEPLKGLLPQPVSENTGVEEWLRQYVNGLLLCKLSRFEEARGELIERFQRTVLSTESEHLLRLGAALCFLSSSGLEEAAEQLRLAGPSVGVFEGYVASVLRLHIAVAEREQATVSELLETLERIREADPTTREAIDAIERRDFSTAVVREVDLLLMAA
jgi:tetratricopeptide (TPR) repeat protein